MNQKSIKFKHGLMSYNAQKTTSAHLEMLGAFLASDVVGPWGAHVFKEWIFDDTSEDISGNLNFLEKENDRIIISSHFSDNPYEWTFECTKEQLAHILDRWAELVPLQPKEIIIIEDGDSYIVEGHGFPSKAPVE